MGEGVEAERQVAAVDRVAQVEDAPRTGDRDKIADKLLGDHGAVACRGGKFHDLELKLSAVRPDASGQHFGCPGFDFHPAFSATLGNPVDEIILGVPAEASDLDLVLHDGVGQIAERLVEAASLVRFGCADEQGDAVGKPLTEDPEEFFKGLLHCFGAALHRVLQEGDTLHPDQLSTEEGKGPDRPDGPVDHLERAVNRVGRQLDGLHAKFPGVGRS